MAGALTHLMFKRMVQIEVILLAMAVLAAVCSAAEAQSAPSAAEVARAHEILRLSMRRDDLLELNRAYVAPAVGVGLGVATLVVGGVVFSQAWGPTSSSSCTNGDCWSSDDYNVRMDRTGLVMMPVGAALILISAPMFALRLSRARRLERTTRGLQRLGELVAIGPSWAGKGVYARLHF